MRDDLGRLRRHDDLPPVDQRRVAPVARSCGTGAGQGGERGGEGRQPEPPAPQRSARSRLVPFSRLASAMNGGRQKRDLLLVRREQLLVAGAVAGRAVGQLPRTRDRLVQPGQPLRHAAALQRAPARLLPCEQRAQLRNRTLVGRGRLGELGLGLVQQRIERPRRMPRWTCAVSAPGGRRARRFPAARTAGSDEHQQHRRRRARQRADPERPPVRDRSHPKRSRRSSAPSIDGHSVGGGSGSSSARAFATSARRSAIAAVHAGRWRRAPAPPPSPSPGARRRRTPTAARSCRPGSAVAIVQPFSSAAAVMPSAASISRRRARAL